MGFCNVKQIYKPCCPPDLYLRLCQKLTQILGAIPRLDDDMLLYDLKHFFNP